MGLTMKNTILSASAALILLISCISPIHAEVASTYSYIPPFLTAGMPPMVMLTMARDHRLYYEAYNDASDIDEDGTIDTHYKPDSIDYYGYFDSYKLYSYDSYNGRFNPVSITANKKNHTKSQYWSGDFLNYLTMTRMDCLRKVLYGGYRSTDTSTTTILERAFIPQDAHSFGKQYISIFNDGYDIRDYAPLPLPETGTRHLLATTAFSSEGNLPKLCVVQSSSEPIWNWVATEQPVVADNAPGIGAAASHPASKSNFDELEDRYAIAYRLYGTGSISSINGWSNPYGSSDNYLTIITGSLYVPTTRTYYFSINGDDCIDFTISGPDIIWSNSNLATIDGNTIGWYDKSGHGDTTNGQYRASVTLQGGRTYTIKYRHEDNSGGDSYRLYYYTGYSPVNSYRLNTASNWTIVPQSTGSNFGLRDLRIATYDIYPKSSIAKYIIRVKVGDPSMPESNCEQYPNKTYKPIGLLQRHGESDRMLFGLMTGSYTHNLSGGVLRQPIGSIKREINTNTGEFLYQDNPSVGGIIRTLDKLTIYGFPNVSGSFYYNDNCGWIVNQPLQEGHCRMWGNPMAEMIYETARYFSGSPSPTAQFTYDPNDTSLDDNAIGLPIVSAWTNPYNATNYCAQPIMLAISDIYPSYDSDQLPGTAWPPSSTASVSTGSTAITSTLGTLNVTSGLTTIINREGLNGTYFIGQSGSPDATGYNGACTPKNISGLTNIRGLCPEEPTKQGSYYAAAVTHYAATHDLNPSTQGSQSMLSYLVALSSPLPEIKIPVAGKTITLVPFAKSPGGSGWGISAAAGDFQPTNTIVDFFVEEISPTTGTFRVNFEDVEQGADHDMDAIVRYHYEVIDNSTVNITLKSEYAAGSITQHIGYIISGSTQDGTYLVIRDLPDSATDADVDYYLDTPPGVYPGDPGTPWLDGVSLPYSSTRTFTPSTSNAAGLLKTPLWYAAKWGGFNDNNGNGIPDDAQGSEKSEWDADGDGIPDTYFYVANPTKLEEQLNKAFADILKRTMSGTAASVISQSRSGEGAVYQSVFFPELADSNGDTINWAGQIHSLFVDAEGNIHEDSNHNTQLDTDSDKIIAYNDTSISRFYANGTLETNSTTLADINFLWTSNDWLNIISDAEVVAQRSQYNATTNNRYIITFADKDNDMVVDAGEIQDFVWPPATAYSALLDGLSNYSTYLTLYPSFSDRPTAINPSHADFGTLLQTLAQRQVDFIRGADQTTNPTIAGYMLPASRSRRYVTSGSTTRTWRLGDIVYSTPTSVGKPAENYNLLYLDTTYAAYVKKYINRRQVIYCGANDGMIHAFNGGFYNSTRSGFDLQHSGETTFPLGMELWAYVPYNLLPHLLWLTSSSYGSQLHVSYVDLKPRIFDARVFFQSDGITPDNSELHPNGWGTIMVAGMRFGGGEIGADVNKTDGKLFIAGTDRSMSSAYVIMDITNPEQPPTVLAEIHMPRQGFTTCYPTAMPMTEPNVTTNTANQWYLVFGSGPADASGDAAPSVIGTGLSAQPGQLYVLDLKALVKDRTIMTVDTTKTLTSAKAPFATTESKSFIANPIALDLDIGDGTSGEFKTDIVYYGTTAGSQTSGTGTMRRLLTGNTMPSSSNVFLSWSGNSTLAELGKPVTSAPSVATDSEDNLWVYFGSGRYYNRNDGNQTSHMSFYGIKDPIAIGNTTSIDPLDLFNSTQITLDNGTCPSGAFSRACVGVYQNGSPLAFNPSQWDTLEALVDARPGWRLDFSGDLERVLGQPAVLSGATIFTSYLPTDDECAFEGTSNLWAVYYKTGTAYFKPILNGAVNQFATSIDLGRGMTITPNLHIGSKSGSTAFIQTSTGAIETIEIENPITTKSGTLYWRENTE